MRWRAEKIWHFLKHFHFRFRPPAETHVPIEEHEADMPPGFSRSKLI